MTVSDRRRFQRLKLAKPILALLDGRKALLLDIGVSGAFVEHPGEFHLGDRVRILFRWRGASIEFKGEVVRSDVVGSSGEQPVSHSGIRFIEPIGDARERLEDMMVTFVGRILAAQRANASGQQGAQSEGEMILARIGEARRSRSRGYVAYRYDGKSWSRTPTRSPQQPPNGFTVGNHEEDEELETLCRSYEIADDEGRNLIRLVAELSVLSADR